MPSKNNKIVSVNLSKEEHKKLKQIAEKESRSVSNTVAILIRKLIEGEITMVTKVKQGVK